MPYTGPGENMLKTEYLIKAALSLIFVIYIGSQGTLILQKLNDKLLAASLNKPPLEFQSKYDYVIAGGSNALLGISAQRINQKTGLSSFNLAISAAEGAGVLNYQEWLRKSNLSAETIIYSSMNLWYLAKHAPFEKIPDASTNQPLKRPFIATPLIRTLSLTRKQSPASTNQYGDITMFACDSEIPYFEASFANTDFIDSSRLEKFIRIINATKKSMHANQILVRIPPIYVSPQSVPDFKKYLSYVHKALRENGATLIGSEDALTTDSKRMCFGPNHPTKEAREEYTDTIIKELTSHKQLVLQ
jgi:hypothetical protein